MASGSIGNKDLVCDTIQKSRFTNTSSKLMHNDFTKNFNLFHVQATVTCLAITNDCYSIYAGFKNDNISGVKLKSIKSYKRNSKKINSNNWPRGIAYCLALSYDDRFLVSSHQDHAIYIWDATNLKYLNVLLGHRGTVYGLAFQSPTYQLFSCGADCMVKAWNVERAGFIDTLLIIVTYLSYGHESPILAIDILEKERAITAGLDHTLRMWKIPEQTQMLFNVEKHTHEICVSMISEQIFVSGGYSGFVILCLTKVVTSMKKPVFVVKNVHCGTDDQPSVASTQQIHEIYSIATIPFNDIIATGSDDGYIKLFRLSLSENTLTYIKSIEMNGYINSLKFSRDGKFLIAGCGKEATHGRFKNFSDKSLNSIKIFTLITMF
ncbi:hypothetical protein HZS_5913 [Henneguya salminicola]|nr:hypothetical protein HZS_5913 [Henneguya salminicola]